MSENHSVPAKPKRSPIPLAVGRPFRDQVYDILKDEILSGRFAPGERVMERRIADSLGLSRIPVREAIRRLEQEGYLIISRNGITVRGISLQELRDLYAVRAQLEGMAAALAAERMRDEDVARLRRTLDSMEALLEENDDRKLTQASFHFHIEMYSCIGNRFLIDFLTTLNEQILRYRGIQFKICHRGRTSIEEDRLVVEAIARRDPQAANRCAQEHVNRLWEHAYACVCESLPGTLPDQDLG